MNIVHREILSLIKKNKDKIISKSEEKIEGFDTTLDFGTHLVRCVYFQRDEEFFCFVSRKSDGAERYINIQPNDVKFGGATVLSLYKAETKREYKVSMKKSLVMLSKTWVDGLNDDL